MVEFVLLLEERREGRKESQQMRPCEEDETRKARRTRRFEMYENEFVSDESNTLRDRGRDGRSVKAMRSRRS